MPLNDTFLKNIKHSGQTAGNKYSDGGGLYLHVTAAGKYWRVRATKDRFDGRTTKPTGYASTLTG